MSGPPGASGAAGQDGLRRQLGVLDAAAIFVGNILGSGIFVAPAAVAAATGASPAGLALWAAGGLVAAAGASCYAECAARLPRTGGFYVYYREAFGPGVAFLGGWAALLVTYPASTAAIALVFAQYLAEVAPVARLDPTVAAAAALLAAGALNVLGVKTGVRAQRALTVTKVAALALLCVAALVAGQGPAPAGGPGAHHASAEPAGGGANAPAGAYAEVESEPGAPSPPGGWMAVLLAMVVVLWTFDGWSDVSLVAGEIRRPGRDLGRAVLVGTLLLAVLYALVQVAVTALLPAERAAASERVVAEAALAGLGPGAGRIVALLVVVATFGSVNGIVLASSRLGFAMARDGAFLRWFGAVHARRLTPARSVWAIVAACVVFVFAAGFRNLLAFFSFSVWIFYGLTAAALLVLRRRRVGEPPDWRAAGGWAAPALVLLTAACMTAGLMVQDPRRSLTGLALLGAGWPAYLIWRRLRRPIERSDSG